jgi:hypothetical protein
VLSHNRLADLAGLAESFPRACHVDVSHNALADLGAAIAQLGRLRALRSVDLRGNPLPGDVRGALLQAIGGLQFVNGRRVTEADREDVAAARLVAAVAGPFALAVSRRAAEARRRAATGRASAAASAAAGRHAGRSAAVQSTTAQRRQRPEKGGLKRAWIDEHATFGASRRTLAIRRGDGDPAPPPSPPRAPADASKTLDSAFGQYHSRRRIARLGGSIGGDVVDAAGVRARMRPRAVLDLIKRHAPWGHDLGEAARWVEALGPADPRDTEATCITEEIDLALAELAAAVHARLERAGHRPAAPAAAVAEPRPACTARSVTRSRTVKASSSRPTLSSRACSTAVDHRPVAAAAAPPRSPPPRWRRASMPSRTCSAARSTPHSMPSMRTGLSASG